MNQWDFLIVHYLGLDHIGHAHGAFNSFIKEKLIEMDEIIEYIYSKINSNDLILITGDHGMIDQGGHGGASKEEIYVPAIFISKEFKENIQDKNEYYQIDLTPTLSALLEISIPFNNLGILIENIIKSFNKLNIYQCLIDDNRRQLFNLLSNTKLSISLNNLQQIRQQAMNLANQQDSILLLLSILLFFISTIILWFNIPKISLLSLVVLILSYLILNNILLSIGISIIAFCLIVLIEGKRQMINYKKERNLSNQLLYYYPIFHIFSLFSSSFIEEEHQTWYYFFSTYLFLQTFENKSWKFFSLLILSRLIRSWNQTGNKWLNHPDIADFLNQSDHQIYLFIIHILSSIIFIYLLNKSKQSSLIYIFPLIALIYRWNLFSSFSSLTPLIYYSLLIYLFVRKQISLRNVIFTLLYLLCRTHNCVIIISHMIFYEYLSIKDASLAFLLSQSAYFHLGNSNSFVTIDISTGFIGIPIYLPIIHGLFIYLSTYGLSIVWLLKLSREQRTNSLIQLTLINCLFSLCVFLQRYHLFVWTVFAPKLFYLCAQTTLDLFLFL
ncbi:hypothetical protein I4U23_027053 [Adineta vaga]|nr:hypothetical protein I4U23_027053 [Adineta vaga]